jgi:hypothetical protein
MATDANIAYHIRKNRNDSLKLFLNQRILKFLCMYAPRNKMCPIFLLFHMSTTDSFVTGSIQSIHLILIENSFYFLLNGVKSQEKFNELFQCHFSIIKLLHFFLS